MTPQHLDLGREVELGGTMRIPGGGSRVGATFFDMAKACIGHRSFQRSARLIKDFGGDALRQRLRNLSGVPVEPEVE